MTRNGERSTGRVLETPLGYKLYEENGAVTARVGDVPLFHGMTSMTRALADKISSAAQLDRIEVSVEKKVKRSENPELWGLHIENVKVTGDYNVLKKVLSVESRLFEHLRKVLGTIQLAPWRNLLYPPEPGTESLALVCPFGITWKKKPYPYRYIVERVRSPKRRDKYFLRISIESPTERHLDLRSIPHVNVRDLEERTVISGATDISEMLRDHVRWQAAQRRCSYTEKNRKESFVFEQLNRAGLSRLNMINIHWTEEIAYNLPEVESSKLDTMFKKILLLLEDHLIRNLLQNGSTIRVEDAETSAFLDLSQMGRVLNVSFQKMREHRDLSYYLDRMPRLRACVRGLAESRPLAGARVLLIHHITPEVLGFIEALRALGAEEVWTLFVRYGAEIPHDYLDAMLALDQKRFRAHVLRNVRSADSAEGYYVLSSLFSDLDDAGLLQARLQAERDGFKAAMVRAALWMFLKQWMASLEDGKPQLIIEDGGYLGPILNEKAMEGTTLKVLLDACSIPQPGRGLEAWTKQPVSTVLKRTVRGTVEHTRNGHDRLQGVQERFGRLVVPSFTIAMSRLKMHEEAADVGMSILMATEMILNAQGWMLQRRVTAVLGGAGAIGEHVVRQLTRRHDPYHRVPVYCVDLKPPPTEKRVPWRRDFTRFRDIPLEERRQIDLILGVTGRPVLEGHEVEELLLRGDAPCLFLASGSTKSIEFEKVSAWVDRFLRGETNRLGERNVRVSGAPIEDPLTGKILGTSYRFVFEDGDGGRPDGPREKHLVFLANLTPVNFTFYGVPREGIDPIITQLLLMSVALWEQGRAPGRLLPKIYRLDWDIDETGRPLAEASLPDASEGRR